MAKKGKKEVKTKVVVETTDYPLPIDVISFYEGQTLTLTQRKYTVAYLGTSKELDYAARVKSVALLYKKDVSNLWAVGKICKWKELDARLNTLHVVESNISQELNQVNRASEYDLPFQLVSFTKLADALRDTTGLSITMLNGNLKHAHMMSVLYSSLIQKTIIKAGGLDNLTTDNISEILEYEKRINGYKESMKFALNPSQISSNLKMLGVTDDLANLNVDTEKMTPDFIQKTLTELVKNQGEAPKTFEELLKQVHYEMELPDIDGRTTKI